MPVVATSDLSRLFEIPAEKIDLTLYRGHRQEELGKRDDLSATDRALSLEMGEKTDLQFYADGLREISAALNLPRQEIDKAFALTSEQVRQLLVLPPQSIEAYEILKSRPEVPPEMELAYFMERIWPSVKPRPVFKEAYNFARKARRFGAPYVSGYCNAIRMLFNPFGIGDSKDHRECIDLGRGLWPLHDYPIRPNSLSGSSPEKISLGIPGDRYVEIPREEERTHAFSGLNALEILLRIAASDRYHMITIENGKVIPGPFFYAGPPFGLGIVGIGDASLNSAARTVLVDRLNDHTETKFGALRTAAEKAYVLSGWVKTDYVKRRQDELHELPRPTGRLAERDWRPPHGYVHI